jgi:hypothetical protein
METNKFDVVNIFIMRRFMDYSNPIKNLVQSLKKDVQISTFLTDYHLRLENRDYNLIDADLGIILIEDFENSRYDSSPDWFKLISKNILDNCSEILILVYGNEKLWKGYNKILGDNCKAEFMSYTIDDDYNIAIIEEKIKKYILKECQY